MSYPKFYDEVESIKVYDALSEFLGTFDEGKYEIGYMDVVKSAGHSCPTVAGAYLMCLVGLKKLFDGEIIKRGEIKVEFKEDESDGVAGVIGNVITHITGATVSNGFKGIGGNFVRHSLMFYNADIDSSVRFTRLDTNKSVEVIYDPSSVPPDSNMQMLIKKIMQKQADKDEFNGFSDLWQDRVKRIFENIDKVITIK